MIDEGFVGSSEMLDVELFVTHKEFTQIGTQYVIQATQSTSLRPEALEMIKSLIERIKVEGKSYIGIPPSHIRDVCEKVKEEESENQNTVSLLSKIEDHLVTLVEELIERDN